MYCQWSVLQGKTVPQCQPCLLQLQDPRAKQNYVVSMNSMMNFRIVSRGNSFPPFGFWHRHLFVQRFDLMCKQTLPVPYLAAWRCFSERSFRLTASTLLEDIENIHVQIGIQCRHCQENQNWKPWNITWNGDKISFGKNICRSLLPRNMLLSGVMNTITSMLIQVHATTRLISGLVQIA